MNIRRIWPVAAFALAACSPSAPTPPAQPPLAGARIGGPFALTDQDGRAVTERNYAGRWKILYFGYTFCPDVCPTDVQAIGAGLKLVEASDPEKAAKLVPIFVTIDPSRDTPAVLKSFVAAFHPRMVGLTGSQAAIDALAKEYVVFAEKGETRANAGYLMNHSRQAYLMDPDGKPIALVPQDQGPKAVADTIRRWVP